MMIARFLFIFGLMGIVSACTPAEEEFYCETSFDCPEGWECGPEYVCVESDGTDTTGGSDNSLPEQDTAQADDGAAVFDEGGVADDVVIVEEDTLPADDAPLTDADAVELDDEPIAEDDVIETDEGEEMPDDEDIAVTDDQPVVDEDTAVVDDATGTDDAAVVDEDTTVADDDAPVVDQDATEKTKIIGTDTYTQALPLGVSENYRNSATIYTAAQVSTTAITITKLEWYASTGAATVANVKISLKETAASTVSAASFSDTKAGSTEVFSGVLTAVAGWNAITLTSPFVYSGTQNLMVVTELTCTANASTSYWRYTDSSSTTMRGWYDDSVPTGNGTSYTNRPNIRLTYY
ncbi:MAG TPA: hypothetical protein PLV42_06430 [bacterium]|nr:hypothetical protein [bacterium]